MPRRKVGPSRSVTVRMPVEVLDAIDGSVSGFLVEAARAQLGQPARWRPLLGDELADRVAKVTVAPSEFCQKAVARAVAAAERDRPVEGCSHPEAERVHQRCRRCGERGLPAVVIKAAAPASAGRSKR